MRRRKFLALSGAAAAAAALPWQVLAQEQRQPRIVFLGPSGNPTTAASLQQGLADLGYMDGRNLRLEIVIAPTIADMPVLAAQVVAGKPDIIVTSASPAPLALKALTTTIPIVFSGLQDPVPIGLVSNYVRPGGNLTGVMQASRDLIPKQIEVIKEVVPALKRLALFGVPADPNYPFERDQTGAATKDAAVETIVFDAVEGTDIDPLFARAVSEGCQAARFVNVAYFNAVADQLAALCLKYRLPSIGRETHARAGILVGYFGTGFNMNPNVNGGRRAAYYVDLILKGIRPGDIPVEGPTNFDFIVNLKTAKALGIALPATVLFQATEVIQ